MWARENVSVRPIVVVCPASLKFHWLREASVHVGMHAEILEGVKPERKRFNVKPQLIVLNYELLWPWMPYLKALDPQLIIFDESHYLRNYRAKRTRGARLLTQGVPHVLALSGTPLLNRPVELYPVLNILCPDIWNSFFTFAQDHCSPRLLPWGWSYTGATRLDTLHGRMLNHCLIRMRKEDVLDQLPEKSRHVVLMEMDDRKQYKHAVKDFIGWLHKQTHGSVKKALRALTLTKLSYLKQLVARLKLPFVLEWVRNFLEGTEGKLVLFAWHTEIVDLLHKEFGKLSVKVNGKVNMKDRQSAVDRFQRDPKCRLFVGNIQAAGVGLNLTAAHSVAFAELPWTPAEVEQGIDRCYARLSDLHGVASYFLLARDTLEIPHVHLLHRKQDVVSRVLDGSEDVAGFDITQELVKALVEEE
jgi:SWI/SNF-related matrix-associated actin-dependent regulator 1 of chromatin subfamily A